MPVSKSSKGCAKLEGELPSKTKSMDDVESIVQTLEHELDNLERVELVHCRWEVSNLQHIFAAAMAFLSGLIFLGNNFIIKVSKLNSGEMLAVRSLVQIVLMSFILFMKGETLWPGSAYLRNMLCLVGLLGSLNMLSPILSVQLMPVSDAVTLMFTAPLFTMLFSALFLKDQINLVKAISGLVLTIGIILITQPEFLLNRNHVISREDRCEGYICGWNQYDEKDISPKALHPNDNEKYHFVGAVIALSTAIFGAAIYIITTKIGNDITPTLQLLYMAIFALMISLFLPLVDETDRFFTSKISDITAHEYVLYVVISCSMIIAYWLVFRSCRIIHPTIVSTLRTTEIVGAFLVECIVTNVAPEFSKVLGATLVVLAALALLFEKRIRNSVSQLKFSR